VLGVSELIKEWDRKKRKERGKEERGKSEDERREG